MKYDFITQWTAPQRLILECFLWVTSVWKDSEREGCLGIFVSAHLAATRCMNRDKLKQCMDVSVFRRLGKGRCVLITWVQIKLIISVNSIHPLSSWKLDTKCSVAMYIPTLIPNWYNESTFENIEHRQKICWLPQQIVFILFSHLNQSVTYYLL